MARTDYTAKVTYSNKELTAREKIAYKDFEGCTKLNDIVKQGESLTLDIANVIRVDVHNEHSKQNTDYSVYVVVTADGNKYRTGSASFFESYCDIIDELNEAGEDTTTVKFNIFKVASNNFDGDFIKASLA